MSLAEVVTHFGTVTHFGRSEVIATDYAKYGIRPGPNTWAACVGHWRPEMIRVTTDREEVSCPGCLEKLAALAVAALRGGG